MVDLVRWCYAATPSRSAAAGEGLAFLAADDFVLVADALALVRLRLADGPHLGGELADLLLVRPLDDDRRRVGHARPSRRPAASWSIGLAKPTVSTTAFLSMRGLVADALDLELLLVALGDALDHVVDQAAGQAVQRPVLPLVVGPGDRDGLAGRRRTRPSCSGGRPTRACPWALRRATLPSATFTLTPAGTATGCLPIRDMALRFAPLRRERLDHSPHGAEQLAADVAAPAGLAVAHHAPAGAEDGDAQAVEHRLQFLVALVHAAARAC